MDGNKRQTVILWLRRDLRLHDNPALAAAVSTNATVIPLYIWSPEEEGHFQPGMRSRWWLYNSLSRLMESFEKLGSRLICRRAEQTFAAMSDVLQETGATTVFFNNLYDPISMVRDHSLKQALTSYGIRYHTFNADLLNEPWEVCGEGAPYTCFEDFLKCSLSLGQREEPLQSPISMLPVPLGLASTDIDDLGLYMPSLAFGDGLRRWMPGEKGGRMRLKRFLEDALHHFSEERKMTDRQSSSELSPHIHYGEISVKEIWRAVQQMEASCGQNKKFAHSVERFRRHLGYREYSRYVSYHYPYTRERAMLSHLNACPWRYDKMHFIAWQQGCTGYPLIDAGMRELAATGWMHNRVRRLTASFLVKNLLLPWQWGLKYFWDTLVDADLECDVLGWQFVSGGLADGLSFDLVDDFAEEGKLLDPKGYYVKRWIPALARLPKECVHTPWLAPPDVLAEAGVSLGVEGNYMAPIVMPEQATVQVREACKVIETVLSQQQAMGAENFEMTGYDGNSPSMDQQGTASTGAASTGPNVPSLSNSGLYNVSNDSDGLVPDF